MLFQSLKKGERKLIEEDPTMLEKSVKKMVEFSKGNNIAEKSKNPVRGIHFYLNFMLTKMLKDFM